LLKRKIQAPWNENIYPLWTPQAYAAVVNIEKVETGICCFTCQKSIPTKRPVSKTSGFKYCSPVSIHPVSQASGFSKWRFSKTLFT
jgi:hypothetical protein